MRPLSRPILALAALCLVAVPVTGAAQLPAPQLSVGGVVLAQYAYQLNDSAGHYNAFDVTRAYLSVTGKFSGGVVTRVTTDIYRGADSSTGVRLKFADLAWTPAGSALTWRFGLTPTPWVGYQDALWDHRLQGPTALDRNGIVVSSDFGATVTGTIGERFSFVAGIFNGEGFAKGTGGKEKDASARASYRLLATDDSTTVGGLRLTGYVQVGTPTGGGTRDRYTGQLSYRTRRVTLAGEYTSADDSTMAGPDLPGRVISLFGVYRLLPGPVALVARTDIYDPDTRANGDRQTRVIAGVSYQVTPNWLVMVDWDHVSFEGLATPQQHARSSALSLHQQFTF